MSIRTLSSEPLALGRALKRIRRRETRALVKARRPSLWQRLFSRHAKREHVVCVPGGETITSNPAS